MVQVTAEESYEKAIKSLNKALKKEPFTSTYDIWIEKRNAYFDTLISTDLMKPILLS